MESSGWTGGARQEFEKMSALEELVYAFGARVPLAVGEIGGGGEGGEHIQKLSTE